MEHTPTLNEAVAAELRAAIARRSITQRQLASASGMSANYLNARLRGRRPFTVEELFTVSSVLKLSPATILRAAFAEIASEK